MNQRSGMRIVAESKAGNTWVSAAVAYLVLHGVLAFFLPDRFSPVSTLLIVIAELVAIFACIRSARLTAAEDDSPITVLWWLLAISVMFHAVAMTLDFHDELLASSTILAPPLQVFFSTLYGIPLLLAVSIRFDRWTLRPTSIIHACLTLATGALFYVEVFNHLTAHKSGESANNSAIAMLFLILDLFLAVAATVRRVGADTPAQRRFFSIASIFLWVNLFFPAAHNWLLVRHDYVWLDLLIAAPYVLLWVMIAQTPQGWFVALHPSARIRRLVHSGSPIFLSLGLLVLGVIVSQTNFVVGMAASLVAILGYGALNTLSESKGMEAEESLRAKASSLQELVGIDTLTRIPNRRAFDDVLERECGTSHRARLPLSLLMIDVDYFKLLNDAQGHLEGDVYLRRIATSLRSGLPRSNDFVARYGGEEFAVILPATPEAGAAEVARKLLGAIAALEMEHLGSPGGRITISIGYSTIDGLTRPAPAELLRTADRALYLAKARGRNRSEFLALDARDESLN